MSTTTTPQATDPIEAARQRRAKAAAAAKKLQADIEARQQQIRDLEEAEKRAVADERAAEEAARVAERTAKLHKHVNLEIAEHVAGDLLRLFEDSRSRRDGLTPAEFWQRLDDIRCRLHSSDIDEDARAIVLGCEFLIGTADRWLINRRSQTSGRPYGSFPVDDHRIETAIAEMQRGLDGTPPPKSESMFALFSANAPPMQMAKMLGITTTEGVGDVEQLARFFSRMAERAALGERRSLAVKRYAAMDDDDAWAIRERRIANGTPDALVSGMPDLGDGGHPNRRHS